MNRIERDLNRRVERLSHKPSTRELLQILECYERLDRQHNPRESGFVAMLKSLVERQP